jgi:hypothetical protein
MKQKAVEIRSFLLAQASVTNVIGAADVARYFLFWGPEGVQKPFITYAPGSVSVSGDGREGNVVLYVWFAADKGNDMITFIDMVVGLLEQKYDVGEVRTYPDVESGEPLLYAEIPVY